jgi:hypothetical protein
VNADSALIEVNGNIQGRAFSHFAASLVPIQPANALINCKIELKGIFK